MWAARVDEGYVFGGLSPACADTLKAVPMLLESSDDRVRERRGRHARARPLLPVGLGRDARR